MRRRRAHDSADSHVISVSIARGRGGGRYTPGSDRKVSLKATVAHCLSVVLSSHVRYRRIRYRR